MNISLRLEFSRFPPRSSSSFLLISFSRVLHQLFQVIADGTFRLFDNAIIPDKLFRGETCSGRRYCWGGSRVVRVLSPNCSVFTEASLLTNANCSIASRTSTGSPLGVGRVLLGGLHAVGELGQVGAGAFLFGGQSRPVDADFMMIITGPVRLPGSTCTATLSISNAPGL